MFKQICFIVISLCSASVAMSYADSLVRASNENTRIEDSLKNERQLVYIDSVIKIMSQILDTISFFDNVDTVYNFKENYLGAIINKESILNDKKRYEPHKDLSHLTVDESTRLAVKEQNDFILEHNNALQERRKRPAFVDSCIIINTIKKYISMRDSLIENKDSSFGAVYGLFELKSKIANDKYLHAVIEKNPFVNTISDIQSKYEQVVCADSNEYYKYIKKSCENFIIKNKENLLKVDPIMDSISKYKDLYAKKIKNYNVVDITGQVQSIEGNKVSLWGSTNLYGCDGTDNCNDDGVLGILHQESNIILCPYKNDLKLDGKAVIGELLQVSGYCYAGKNIGKNSFNANVPIYVFAPSPYATKLADIKDKIDKLKDELVNIFTKSGITKEYFSTIENFLAGGK